MYDTEATHPLDASDEAMREAQSTLLRLCLHARSAAGTAHDTSLPVLCAVRQLAQWRNAHDAALCSSALIAGTVNRQPSSTVVSAFAPPASLHASISLEELMAATPSYCLSTEKRSSTTDPCAAREIYEQEHDASRWIGPRMSGSSNGNANEETCARQSALHAQLERRRIHRTFVACPRNACCVDADGVRRYRCPWSGLCQPVLAHASCCRTATEGDPAHLLHAVHHGTDAKATTQLHQTLGFVRALEKKLNESLPRYMDAYEDDTVSPQANQGYEVVCRHAATAFVRVMESSLHNHDNDGGGGGVPSERSARTSAPIDCTACEMMEIVALLYRDASDVAAVASSSCPDSLAHRRLVCGHAFELHFSSAAVTIFYESSILLYHRGDEDNDDDDDDAATSLAMLAQTPCHPSCHHQSKNKEERHEQCQGQSTSYYRKFTHRPTTLRFSQLCRPVTRQGIEEAPRSLNTDDVVETHTHLDVDAMAEIILRCIETEENELDSLLHTNIVYMSQKLLS